MRIRSHTLIPVNKPGRFLGKLASACVALSLMSSSVYANSEDQAARLHQRVAGVSASIEVRKAMAEKIAAGDAVGAAMMATEHEGFGDVILSQWAKPATNEERSSKVPLTDFAATMIGLVLTEADYRTVLYGDVVFHAANEAGITPYATNNNDHYAELENIITQPGKSYANTLVAGSQSGLGPLGAGATAGVLTTRAAAESYLIAGTNRAMFAFTMENFLCKGMEALGDTSGPSDRIRQDVERSPGADSAFFTTYCIKCHSQMDSNSGAFAYYTYDEEAGEIVYTDGEVQPKYLRAPDGFREGYVTTDDSWTNPMRDGLNMVMGWDETLTGTGKGPQSWGQEIAHSREFAVCQVKKAFEATCLAPPETGGDLAAVEKLADNFIASNYNLKRTFAETAVYCMGQ